MHYCWFCGGKMVYVQEERPFLLAFEGSDAAAVASYSPTQSIASITTSPYHHIADISLRGHNEELRVIMTTPSHWSTAGYHRHGRDSTAESIKPRTARTAMEIHRICIPTTVRSSGDDYPRMILRRSQEACRESVLPRSAGSGRA